MFDDSVKPMRKEQVSKHLGRSGALDAHSSLLQNEDDGGANELNGSLLQNTLDRRLASLLPLSLTREGPSDNDTGNNARARALEPLQPTDGPEARLHTLESYIPDRAQALEMGYGRDRNQSDIRIQATPTYEGRTSDGSYFIRRNFKLSRPADPQRGGYIVQTVRVTIQDVGPDGRPVGRPRTYEYSEAWRVAGGKDRPLEGAEGHPDLGVPWANDSISGSPNEKSAGVVTVSVTTRFYDGMSQLPNDFQRNSVIFAGPLFATATPFDQLQFDGASGPATTTSFPPIFVKRKGQR